MTALHQREPCGKPRARKRAGLSVIQAFRGRHQRVFTHNHIFGQHALEVSTGRVIGQIAGVRCWPTVDPLREKGRDDASAGCETRDALARAFHHSRHIGRRRKREGKRNRHGAFNDHFIAIVERNGVHPYADFTRPWLRNRRLDEFEVVAPEGVHGPALHCLSHFFSPAIK